MCCRSNPARWVLSAAYSEDWKTGFHDARSQRLKDVYHSVSESFARYLAAAGRFNSEARIRARELLKTQKRERNLPVA